MAVLNVLATQIRFSGSCSELTMSAREVLFSLQSQLPPFVAIQMPKYPTRTLRLALPTMFAIAVVTPGCT